LHGTYLLRGVTQQVWGVRVRINTIHVERVPWIPHDVDVVFDWPDGQQPVLWVREGVPEATVVEQLAAASARLYASSSSR
jgi:hypothetical protein